MQLRAVNRCLRRREGPILAEDEVVLASKLSRGEYPNRLRRVTSKVELDGKLTVMELLSNNFERSPAAVADLYRCRWQIEVFFKRIKQTLQLCDFLGHSANAVRWQVWTALLLYLLLRFQTFLSDGAPASPNSSPCFAPSSGTASISQTCSPSMGQPVTDGACAHSPNKAISQGSPSFLWYSPPLSSQDTPSQIEKFRNSLLLRSTLLARSTSNLHRCFLDYGTAATVSSLAR